MSVCLAADRAWIEEKYHKKDAAFDPFRRMSYHGHAFDASTGLDDDEIKAGLRALAEETQTLPHPVAKARAVAYVLEHTRIEINEHDYFVGIYSLDRLISETTVDRWSREVFHGELSAQYARMKALNHSCAWTMGPDFDHVVPDWDSLMTLGIPGLRERARRYRQMHEASAPLTAEQTAFFDSIELEYTALIAFFDRLWRHACTQSHAKAQKIAACLLHLRDGAPGSFYEALQLLYVFAIVSECIDFYQMRSLGNGLDHTLFPFMEKDLSDGTCTHGELREYLAHFMLQFSAIGNYWGHPFYLGGSNEDGSTRVNALSYEILDVYEALDIYNPKIQIKYSETTPAAFLDKALDSVRRGHGAFTFCCEPTMIRAAMRYGATLAEARTLDVRGCFEIGVRANEVSAEAGTINAAGALLLALFRGIDPSTDQQVGLCTADLSTVDAFAPIYEAFLEQLDSLIDAATEIATSYERYFEYVNPSSIYSATVESSLKNAKDGYGGGVKYNNSALALSGLATAVDGLLALRYLVFEEKLTTVTELCDILRQDWQGAEALRAKALHCPYKYGAGNPDANALFREIAEHFAARVNGRANGRGGVFKASIASALAFVRQGERTAATPDGRRAGEETSKNASPTPGMDKNGVTELILSATEFAQDLFPETCVLDALLHPSAVAGESGLLAMRKLLEVYGARGGMVIQFNVFDSETLQDARRHPERYQSLQVRVAGWNVLWNNLSPKEQDAYVTRTASLR